MKGVVGLQDSKGSSVTFVSFMVRGSLAADVLLGTTLIDTHVKTVSKEGRRFPMTQHDTISNFVDEPIDYCHKTVATTQKKHVHEVKSSSSSI